MKEEGVRQIARHLLFSCHMFERSAGSSFLYIEEEQER